MKSNWIKIHSSARSYEIEVMKAFLLNNDIKAFVIDKTDSMNTFLTNGEIELFVDENDVIKAKKLLANNPL
jgi:hypothetical protein